MPEPLVVTHAEAGQKLLQFLARRFDLPHGVFHRWIRTGQVRINGSRARAFDRVEEKDEIRVPPFAFDEQAKNAPSPPSQKTHGDFPRQSANRTLPPIMAETDDLIVFCKPSGLPVHPGSGHTDSLTTRIETRYAGADFMPTPVHRLDRDTSGLILVAKTYRAVRRLSDALASHDGQVVKEYLAWVAGTCPWDRPVLLADRLAKHAAEPGGRERVHVRNRQTDGTDTEKEREASLTICCVARRNKASLVLIRLHTGRTHQIRAQLSERGFPLLGDVKYGGPRLAGGLLLHAARLVLNGRVYQALPDWEGERRVTKLPPSALLDNPLPEAGHTIRGTNAPLFHDKGKPPSEFPSSRQKRNNGHSTDNLSGKTRTR